MNPYDSLVNFINRHNISPQEENKLREIIAEIKKHKPQERPDPTHILITELKSIYDQYGYESTEQALKAYYKAREGITSH